MYSEGRTDEELSFHWKRWIAAALIVGILFLLCFVAGMYLYANSGKVMHTCWDGSEAETCPPSGVSQGEG